MNKQEFLTLKRQIDKLLQKAEDEALAEGVDITSNEFLVVFNELKRKILDERGVSLEDYNVLDEEIKTGKEIQESDRYSLYSLVKVGKELEKEINIEKGKIDTKIKELQNSTEKMDTEKMRLFGKVETLLTKLEEKKGILDKQTKEFGKIEELKDKFYREALKKDREIDNIKDLIKQLPTNKDIDNVKKEIKNIPKPEKPIPPKDIKKEVKEEIKNEMDKLQEMIDKRINDLAPRFLAIPSRARQEQVISEIDLSSQCDGSTTEFTLGRAVTSVVLTNLNGTIVSQTLNTAKTKITLAFAPETGEELKAITLI